MEIRVPKHNYFSSLIASADSHLAALFQVTRSFLEENKAKVYLKGHSEEYAAHLAEF